MLNISLSSLTLCLISTTLCFILTWFSLSLDASLTSYMRLRLWGGLDNSFDFTSIRLSSVLIVLFVSASVSRYSFGYIRADEGLTRFCILLGLFVSSMGLFLSTLSPLACVIGWDGLGVVSYFLVKFYLNPSRRLSSKITVFSNRLGDVFFMMLLSLFFIFRLGLLIPSGLVILIAGLRILLVLTRITKSAQFPFSVWLPAAISAPTPVSSLVHSSTLVTAGLFLLLKFRGLRVRVRVLLLFPLVLWTLAVSRVLSLTTSDLKTLVALSTLSQLSLIFCLICRGLTSLATIHIILHAFFKSGLFISVGAYIHEIKGSQDPRLSRSSSSARVLKLMILLTLLGLRGLAFYASFFTKEAYICYLESSISPLVSVVLVLARAMLTLSYRKRLVVMLLSSSPASRSLRRDSLNLTPVLIPALFSVLVP